MRLTKVGHRSAVELALLALLLPAFADQLILATGIDVLEAIGLVHAKYKQ